MKRSRKVVVCLALSIFAGVCPAWADGGQTARLDALIEEAIKNSPEIAAARNGVSAAKALKPQAWGLDNPMLIMENENSHKNPFDGRSAEQERLGFLQNIPFPAKLFGRYAVAAKEVTAAQAKYDQTVNDVVRDVKKAYADLFLATRTKQLLEESRQALDSFRDVANRKYSLGKASQADVLGADTEVGKVINEITKQEALIISAQAELKALLNRSGDEDFVLPESQQIVPLEAPVDDLVHQSKEINPSLRETQAEIEKAQASLGLAKLEYAPDVQIQTEFRQVDGGPDVWQGFLGVSVPLWAWKQQGMIAQAKSILDQKKDAWGAEKNKTIAAVREAYARAQSNWHVLENLKTLIIPQAEQTLKVSESAYENDKVDFFTLISYWILLLNYRIDSQRATAQYQVAMADLERAVGVATAQGLGSAAGEGAKKER